MLTRTRPPTLALAPAAPAPRAPARCDLCHQRSTLHGDPFCRHCRKLLVDDFVRWLHTIDPLGSLLTWNAPLLRDEEKAPEERRRAGMHSWRDDEDRG